MAGGESRNMTEGSVARATIKSARISPRKARLALEMITGRQVELALNLLEHSPRRASKVVSKLLRSAVANAKEGASVDVDNLWVTGGWVNMAKPLKRWLPRAHGRATPLRKRSAHITILLGER